MLRRFRGSMTKHLLRSKVETYRSPGESQGSQLVLEVQGRLA